MGASITPFFITLILTPHLEKIDYRQIFIKIVLPQRKNLDT